MAENGYLAKDPQFATKAIHCGQDPSQWKSGAIIPPITLSTTFKQTAPGEHNGFEYGRSGNPSRSVLEECLAALDNGKYALCFSSGLGAGTAIINLLQTGDHLVSCDDIYGGTYRYFSKVASTMGISSTFVDAILPENVSNAITEKTKLVWVESPTNPTMKVIDIQAIAKVIKEKNPNIIFVVDNTFLTPYFQRPLELGADIVVYSLTKYMNGHSDVIMGAAITSDNAIHQKLGFLQNAMGIVPSPFDCFLINRSLKTLHLRMDAHMKNSILIAKFLNNHKAVEKVLHPALPSHPQYDICRKQCSGHSGVFSFYLKGGLEHSRKFLSSLKVFTLAESLGGFESLAELPSMMTHATIPPEERKKLGISDSLIRLSVGLEGVNDLIEDIDQALNLAMKI